MGVMGAGTDALNRTRASRFHVDFYRDGRGKPGDLVWSSNGGLPRTGPNTCCGAGVTDNVWPALSDLPLQPASIGWWYGVKETASEAAAGLSTTIHGFGLDGGTLNGSMTKLPVGAGC